jgi:hypothetical protein
VSGRIGSPLRLAIVGTILFSGIVIGLRGSTARAENCLTEPNSAAPAGSHWYYRSDRANQRKCWYLRGVSESIEQATPETTAARAAASENRATSAPISTDPKENVSSLPLQLCSPSEHCQITIVTANSFQRVLPPNKADAPQRRTFTIENTNTNGDSCWIYLGSESASKEASQKIIAGQSYVLAPLPTRIARMAIPGTGTNRPQLNAHDYDFQVPRRAMVADRFCRVSFS